VSDIKRLYELYSSLSEEEFGALWGETALPIVMESPWLLLTEIARLVGLDARGGLLWYPLHGHVDTRGERTRIWVLADANDTVWLHRSTRADPVQVALEALERAEANKRAN